MNPADVWLWVVDHWWQTAIGVWTGVLTATLALCRAAARDDDRPTPPNPNPPLLASVTVDDADWLRAHNWAD